MFRRVQLKSLTVPLFSNSESIYTFYHYVQKSTEIIGQFVIQTKYTTDLARTCFECIPIYNAVK